MITLAGTIATSAGGFALALFAQYALRDSVSMRATERAPFVRFWTSAAIAGLLLAAGGGSIAIALPLLGPGGMPQ